jgi:uncharacterized protein with FMN-binding domain
MRRAILVAAGTVAGLVALLDYKSSGALRPGHVAAGGGVPVSAGPPATTAPSASSSPASSSSSASTPASSPTTSASGRTTSPSTTAGPATYTGADVEYVYGNIQVRITVADDRITAISTPEQSASDPHSAAINAQAIPILTQEAIAAQGVHFDVVSGATFTSNAFAQSLESALGKEPK